MPEAQPPSPQGILYKGEWVMPTNKCIPSHMRGISEREKQHYTVTNSLRALAESEHGPVALKAILNTLVPYGTKFPPAPPELPPNWKWEFSEANGKTFFYNVLTGEKTWNYGDVIKKGEQRCSQKNIAMVDQYVLDGLGPCR